MVAGLCAGVAAWSFLRHADEPERPVSRFTVNVPSDQALTSALDPSLAISPDGSSLVYVGGSHDKQKLYFRSIDQLEARSIPGTEGASSPFFSPDGAWVGFFSGNPVQLRKVKVETGLPITLTDVPNPWGASWGPDDTILFAPDYRSGLSRVAASAGVPSVASTPDPSQEEISHHWPEILPDGRNALFTILTSKDRFHIGILDLSTGQHRILLEDGSFARYIATGHLAYMHEGRFLVVPFDLESLKVTGETVYSLEGLWMDPAYGAAQFALSRNGTLAYVPSREEERRLVLVDRAGVIRPMSERLGVFEDPRFSPDGQKLALTRREHGESHVWIYEIERASFTRLTFGPGDEQAPLWTPDGNRISFRAGAPSNLYWQPADGSGPEERLTASTHFQRACSWSPDGKTLVYLERTGGFATDDLWLLSLEGEREKRALLDAPFRETHGAVSPNGQFLAYQSDETGSDEIFVRPFPRSGGKWRLSDEGGTQPVWSRSGREIFYRNANKMMAVRIETEPAFRAGQPTILFEGSFHLPETSFPQFDIAPEDQSFVMIQARESWPTQIHVVLNWFEELKASVPTRPH
jgi:serine/threonine-protein kinase